MLAACSESPRLDPDGFAPDDIAFAVTRLDGAPVAQRVERQIGQGFEVDRDAGSNVALFRVRRDELVRTDGAPLEPAFYAAVEACLDDPPGRCPPCTLPDPDLPQMLVAGDACPLARELPGALFSDDGTCRGGSGGLLCRPGPPDVLEELDAVRRILRLRAPGPEASSPRVGPSFAGWRVEPVAPAAGAEPMNAWSGDALGVVGIGPGAAYSWSRREGPGPLLRFEGPIGRPLGASLTPSGVVMVAERSSLSGPETFPMYRLRRDALGRLEPPEPLAWRLDGVRPRGLRTSGDTVWIHGFQDELVSREPALVSCSDSGGCLPVALEGCRPRSATRGLTALEAGVSDQGFALSERALFVGSLDRNVTVPWRCHAAVEPIPRIDGGPDEVLRRLLALAVQGERLYACAEVDSDPCGPSRSVVLTSTRTSEPVWRVLWDIPNDQSCKSLSPVPDPSAGVRVHLSEEVYDIGPEGPTSPGQPLSEAYGSIPGALEVQDLEDERRLVMGPGGRVHLVEEGATTQVYGPADANLPDWVGAARSPDGGLWLLDERTGLHLMSEVAAPTPTPLEVGLETVRWTAIAAHPVDGDVLLTTARRGFVWLPRGEPSQAWAGSLPLDLGQPTLAEVIGPARFVVLDDRTQAALVTPAGARMLEITFDDPSTDALEPVPIREPTACRPSPGPAHHWRSAGRAEDVVWASGVGGLLVRFTAAGGLRRALPTTATLDAIRVDRADRVVVAGFGPSPGGPATRRLQVFEVNLSRGWATPGQERHREVIETSGSSRLLFGMPRVLFSDELEPSSVMPVLLQDGSLARLGAGAELGALRVPFRPTGAQFLEPQIVVLFGAEGRIAAGYL